MLKKLRLKFVCITMTIVTVMLCVIFGMVLHSTAQNLEHQSLQMLQRLAAEPIQPGRPGAPQDEVRLPYLALQVEHNGTILAKVGGYFDLSDEVFLRQLLERAGASGENTGVLREYDLRYYRNVSPRGQYIVFADISSEQQTLRSLAGTCLLIGILSSAAFLGLSFLLARWAVKPVEQAWAEQRQFVADASHELKTPLTVIMTNGELLASLPQGDQRREQCIGSINTTARQMRGLVEGLLDLARVDNGAMQTVWTTVDLSAAVNGAMLPFEAVFFEADLELSGEVEPDIQVKGSEGHLQQVVEILLDNAQKYSYPNTAVQLRLERKGTKECLLSVANRGEPIAQEDLKNIFKRFYRVDKARSMDQSYGLGLSIAQSIVEEHKGRIWAESAAGINTFFVLLPVSAAVQ